MLFLLTIDALRRDVLGCYGGDPKLSPFIDSIQKKMYTVYQYTRHRALYRGGHAGNFNILILS